MVGWCVLGPLLVTAVGWVCLLNSWHLTSMWWKNFITKVNNFLNGFVIKLSKSAFTRPPCCIRHGIYGCVTWFCSRGGSNSGTMSTKNFCVNTSFFLRHSLPTDLWCLDLSLKGLQFGLQRGVSGPVVRALDSGSDGPGSSPGWGTTLWP